MNYVILTKYLLELSNPNIKYLNIKYFAINTLINQAASTLSYFVNLQL